MFWFKDVVLQCAMDESVYRLLYVSTSNTHLGMAVYSL